jgi:hypothetical protein
MGDEAVCRARQALPSLPNKCQQGHRGSWLWNHCEDILGARDVGGFLGNNRSDLLVKQ